MERMRARASTAEQGLDGRSKGRRGAGQRSGQRARVQRRTAGLQQWTPRAVDTWMKPARRGRRARPAACRRGRLVRVHHIVADLRRQPRGHPPAPSRGGRPARGRAGSSAARARCRSCPLPGAARCTPRWRAPARVHHAPLAAAGRARREGPRTPEERDCNDRQAPRRHVSSEAQRSARFVVHVYRGGVCVAAPDRRAGSVRSVGRVRRGGQWRDRQCDARRPMASPRGHCGVIKGRRQQWPAYIIADGANAGRPELVLQGRVELVEGRVEQARALVVAGAPAILGPRWR